MSQRRRGGVRWPLVAALIGICCSLVLLPDTASSEHTESPGEGYEWVPTPGEYTERQNPLNGIHYDWWRCADSSGCIYGPESYVYGTTRSLECEIPGGAGRVGLGHCGALLGGSADMCPVGDFGDCYGEHDQAGGWSQVLGPHNPRPGQYDPRLCVAADNQDDVGALPTPTPGHYDCWPVPGTWDYEASCGGEVMAERGQEHCGYWRPPTTPTPTTPTPTTPTPTPTTTTKPTPTPTTTTKPTPTATTTTTPTTQECARRGFVWFSEYGGCRPEDCSAIGGGYVRNPDDGWCEPAPPPGDVLNSCVANFEILFPHLAGRSSYDEPAERREYCSRRRLNYVPVWVTDHDGDPVREGTTATVTHRVLHITGATPVLNPPFDGFDWNPDNRCDGADERNVYPSVDYDCLRVSVTVRAGFAGVNHSGSYFRASGCANPVGWAQTAERVCDSAAGAWYGTARDDDPGEWTVTVGDLARAGTSDHLVSVPFVVDVTDWGDADRLHVTAVATDYWDGATNNKSRDTLTFEVARREGPPPSSDIIEVNVAEVADLPYREGGRWVGWPRWRWRPHIEDERFVEIARSDLLANDACPDDLDCTDPAQWPVSIPAPEAQRCSSWAFRASSPMLVTPQGLVGCDDLNDASEAVVQYWPQHWAAGTDTFTYETPGGAAAVTVRFTDAPPAVQQLVASDAGTALDVAVFGTPNEWFGQKCKSWNRFYNTCQYYGYDYVYYVTYTRDPAVSFSARHYSTAATLDAIRDGDPDGDAARVEITDAHNPHLHGNAATVAGTAYSHWRLAATAEATVPRCYLTCHSSEQAFASFVSGSTLTTATNPADGSTTSVRRSCVTDAATSVTDEITSSQAYWDSYPGSVARWAAADASDPGCLPQVAAGCQAATLADWSLCYSLWPATSGPQQLDVAYRACDERFDAFDRDRADAEAAGRSESDYCSEGTITVLLGDCVWDPTDADRAALAARVGWHSFLEALPEGPPGEPWPPHPEVPGGDRHIVIADSPVWPRVAAADDLDWEDGSGCVWSARWLQSTVTQMLPWVPAHRAAVEAHGGVAPWAGRWDRLSADQQAEAQSLHVDGDLTSVACPVTAAADGTQPADQNLSYQLCRWELPRPGLWHWTLDAEYTDGTRTVTETLSEDITWFRSFDAYTSQRTRWRRGRAQAAAG